MGEDECPVLQIRHPLFKDPSRFIDAFMEAGRNKEHNQKGHCDAHDIKRSLFSIQGRGFEAIENINDEYSPDHYTSLRHNQNHTNYRERP